MSGVDFTVETEVQIASEAGGAEKTILQLKAATNHRVLVREISLTLQDNADVGGELEVKLRYQSSAGSALDPVTPGKLNQGDDETIQATALRGKDSGTSEPTSTAIIARKFISRGGGEFFWTAIRERDKIPIRGGDRLGITVEGENWKAQAYMIAEE